MADISNQISDEALAQWFKEVYEQADPASIEGMAYHSASDKKTFRESVIEERKEFLNNVEEKREELNRLLNEAEAEAGPNATEEEKDEIFENKLFAPENDFIFDAIHPDFLAEKYNILGDEIALAEDNQQALPLIIMRAKIRDRIDQLINNLGDDLQIDETLVSIYPEDAEGLILGYQNIIETRRLELENEIEGAEDDNDRTNLQEKLDVIAKIQEAMDADEQEVEETENNENIEKMAGLEQESSESLNEAEVVENRDQTQVINDEPLPEYIDEKEPLPEMDWQEKELQSWNEWCIDEHRPPYPPVVIDQEAEGLRFDIYTNEEYLTNEENKAATIHYYSENQAALEMEEDKTPEFEIFDKFAANTKNNGAPGITFEETEEMTPEFQSRLAAACLNNDIQMENAPKFIDVNLLGDREKDHYIYDNVELMRKIDEYNRANAARQSEKSDEQKFEEMVAREYRMTHFKEPDLSTPEGNEEYKAYRMDTIIAYREAELKQKDLTQTDFMESRWAKMEERMQPQSATIFLGGKSVRTEDMLKDFEEHQKNHTEHESLFALALKDSLERSNKKDKVFEQLEDAAFYAGEMVKGTDTPFIRGTRDISKLNDYEKQYINEDNFKRFSKTSRIFCGKLDDFFSEAMTVEEYDEQFKLYKSDHTQGWLMRAHPTKTNAETAWDRMKKLSSPQKTTPQRINTGAER